MFTVKFNTILFFRAVSSVGRATGLHPVGRRFEPVTAHHYFSCWKFNKIEASNMYLFKIVFSKLKNNIVIVANATPTTSFLDFNMFDVVY